MYHTIKDGKNAIKSINKVYPILEEIFNGRASMTRKEILKEYSKVELETKYYGRSHYYSNTYRVLPTFETLRHLGLLVVVDQEEKISYYAEDQWGEKEAIAADLYRELPRCLQDHCEEMNYLRYFYELTPREIVIERILNAINENLNSLMKLVE